MSTRLTHAPVVGRLAATTAGGRATAITCAIARGAAEIPGMPVHAVRIASMAEVLADVGAGIEERHLVAIGRIGLAIFVFDDLVDEDNVDVDDLRHRAAQLADCAAGHYVPELAFDPLACFVRATAAQLRCGPASIALWPSWTVAMQRLFLGIVEHRVLADRLWQGDVPSFDELLDVGGRSIGMEAFATAAWMILGGAANVGDASWQPLHDRLAHATRLANDLCTADRDAHERAANLLFVVGPRGTADLARRLDDELDVAARLVADMPAAAREVGRFNLALAHGIVRRYAHRDFHVAEGT